MVRRKENLACHAPLAVALALAPSLAHKEVDGTVGVLQEAGGVQ